MAVTTTTRLGVYRWSAGTDEFNRAQMDASHSSLEDKAAIFLAGTFASRPAVSAAVARAFYLATDQNSPVGILYYCDGSTWQAVNSFATPTGVVTPGSANTQGTALTLSRSDHVHALPAWGVVGEIATVGTAAAEGSLVKFARIDHAHFLANGSVTAGKIATGGVSASNQIANNIIQSYHFAPGAVSGAAISADSAIPTGLIAPYGGITAPTGWLFCDGASYDVANYAALHGVIQYRYGGSGANFNVPNLVDRLPRGATSFTTSAALGVTGGADAVMLTTNNLPQHSHTITHSHTGSSGNQSADHTHPYTHTHGTFPTSVTVNNESTDMVRRLSTAAANQAVSGRAWNTNLMQDSGGNYANVLAFMHMDYISGHGHTGSGSVTIGAHTGSTDNQNANHNHPITINDSVTTNSGNAGQASPTGVDVRNKFQSTSFIIKI